MRNFKQNFRRFDFIAPFIVALPLAWYFYNQRSMWKCRASTYNCPHEAIMMSIAVLLIAYFISFIRRKFVYGSPEYQKMILDKLEIMKKNEPRKNFSSSWLLLIMLIVVANLFFISVISRNYQNSLILFDVLAFLSSALFLTINPPKNRNFYFLPVLIISPLLLMMALILFLNKDYGVALLVTCIVAISFLLLKKILKY